MTKNVTKKLMVVLGFVFLLSMTAFAQDYPKIEVPVGFSFVNVHPDITPITSFNVFGGGGGFVYNFSPIIGIKADFEGYTQGSGLKDKLTSAGYTVGNLQGNVFTYMFGPQFKKHSGKMQPFAEALFGAAHSNAYANIYNTIHGGISGSSNNNAFAMEFGGGLDFALTKTIQVRPVEVDYLYTRFGINGTSYTGAQNNFKYLAGVNFTFGGK
jgi:opacity protein-like surface antigen